MSIEGLLQRFAHDAKEYGPRALDTHVEELAALIESGHGPTRAQAAQLLGQLRGQRCFATMLDVADLLGEDLSWQSRIFVAQALTDRDRLIPARTALEKIRQDFEAGRFDDDFPSGQEEKARRKLRSEVLGLFGRIRKQRFVSAHLRGDDEAVEHLRQAMQHHQDGYELDPAWHGANMAALAWRGAKEGYALGDLPSAVEIGKQLEAEQRRKGAVPELGPWDVSALAQARMAQGDWEEGLDLYGSYIRMLQGFVGDGAAFMLMGDLRQLREIWRIDKEGDGPRIPTLRALVHAILAHPEGRVTLTLEELGNLERDDGGDDGDQLQALLGVESTILPTRVVENLRPYLKSICRIHGRPGTGREGPVGSGFLVDAEAIGSEQRMPVLVTNAHVLSTQARHSASTLFPEEATAYFEAWSGGDEQRTVAIEEVLWESPPDRYDVAVFRVGPLPAEAVLTRVTRRPNPWPQPCHDPRQCLGTVVPIGYPGGRDLSYSFGSNPILDHDLHRDLGSPRVVHYKADTEPGSSGCPIFDRSGDVVAIHRKFTTHRIAGSPKRYAGRYAANEGIGLHAARRACREDVAHRAPTR